MNAWHIHVRVPQAINKPWVSIYQVHEWKVYQLLLNYLSIYQDVYLVCRCVECRRMSCSRSASAIPRST